MVCSGFFFLFACKNHIFSPLLGKKKEKYCSYNSKSITFVSLDIKSLFRRGKKGSFIFLTLDIINFKGIMHYQHRPFLINLFIAGDVGA